MRVRLPTLPSGFRWVVTVWAVLIFAWLGLEDVDRVRVTVLGVGTAAVVALRWVAMRGGRILSIGALCAGGAALGALVGAGSTVTTALLMFFKNAYHAHVFPDYPTALILDTLALSPLWAGAGVFAGLGLALAWAALRGQAAGSEASSPGEVKSPGEHPDVR